MKLKWFSLVLVFFFLCGCAEGQVSPTLPAPEMPSVIPFETEPAGLYQPGSHLEEATGGALKVFPLTGADATAIAFLGEDLLLIQGREQVTLSLLSGETRYISASLSANLSAGKQTVQLWEDGLVYWDHNTFDLVFLDASLKEIRRVRLPETVTGCPILSENREAVYYCTENALRVLELSTGLHRLLREMSFPQQHLTAIHWRASVLECTVTDQSGRSRKLLLSTEDGRLLRELPENTALQTNGDFYICEYPDGDYSEILCGRDPEAPLVLELPHPDAAFSPIPQLHGSIAAAYNPQEDATVLDFLDPDTGLHPYSLKLPGNLLPASPIADPGGDALWFLLSEPATGSSLLCRWDLSLSDSGDTGSYLRPRYSLENPDLEGILECQSRAAQISETHGIRPLLWTEAATPEPWDYDLIPEHRVPVIRHCLEKLDAAFSRYPAGFLEEAASATKSKTITVRLVKSLRGRADTGAPSLAAGAQYRDADGNIQLLLASGSNPEQTLHHELFHIFESRVFSLCDAYDYWQLCNPPGFAYDYNYSDYLSREDSPLLTGDTRAFIDAYSMSYPREDRARIMEYAMLPDREACFRSEIMQAKLRILCLGLREAFRLTGYPQSLPWEQYLAEPLQ